MDILLPTRGRPNDVERLYKSCLSTAAHPELIEFIFYVDDDDKVTLDKVASLGKIVSGPRGSIPLSECTNQCFEVSRKGIVFCAGDDIVFHTKGWDDYVYNTFNKYNDRLVLCGANDLLNKDILTHFFLHGNFAGVFGKLIPYTSRDMYIDTFMNELFYSVGRLEILPCIIEHCHYSAGKHEYDQTAREKMEKIQQKDEAGEHFMRTKLERIKQAQQLDEYIRAYSKLS